jgi:hypothetical protein
MDSAQMVDQFWEPMGWPDATVFIVFVICLFGFLSIRAWCRSQKKDD